MPTPPDDGRLASRLRFENPATFIEFYDKQLARALLAVRHPRPVPEGTAILIVVSPPGAPDRLCLGGRVVRVKPRPDGGVRLRVAVECTPDDRTWLDAYLTGLRAALAATPNDPLSDPRPSDPPGPADTVESVEIDPQTAARLDPGPIADHYWRMAREALEHARGEPGALRPALAEAIRLLRVARALEPDNAHVRHALDQVEGRLATES